VKTVSVSEVKARLAKYLRLVGRGGEVQILDRGVPVARLIPCSAQGAAEDSGRVERLAREGILRKGAAELAWLISEPPLIAGAARLTQAVSDDREDRL
jgi:prevent-host-death family protein